MPKVYHVHLPLALVRRRRVVAQLNFELGCQLANPGNANLPIGVRCFGTVANREIGVPRGRLRSRSLAFLRTQFSNLGHYQTPRQWVNLNRKCPLQNHLVSIEVAFLEAARFLGEQPSSPGRNQTNPRATRGHLRNSESRVALLLLRGFRLHLGHPLPDCLHLLASTGSPFSSVRYRVNQFLETDGKLRSISSSDVAENRLDL